MQKANWETLLKSDVTFNNVFYKTHFQREEWRFMWIWNKDFGCN